MNAPRSFGELALVPEALTLEILDVALAAAQNALVVVHPEHDMLSEMYGGRLPPPSVLLATLLLDRLEEVRRLLAWYRTTYRADEATRYDDDPF